jgi:hypothetical protein
VAEIYTRDRRRQHGASHYGLGRTFAVLRDLLAVRFIIDNPRRAELRFALVTAATAAVGAFMLARSLAATIALDALAVLLASVWWNARRFNRAPGRRVSPARGERVSLRVAHRERILRRAFAAPLRRR